MFHLIQSPVYILCSILRLYPELTGKRFASGFRLARRRNSFSARNATEVACPVISWTLHWCDAGMRDLSKVQSPYEGGEGTHLSQAAEVDVSAMHQSEDAKAEVEIIGFEGEADCPASTVKLHA
jgi:hypothetical protein